MKRVVTVYILCFVYAACTGTTIYVDNVNGSRRFNGLSKHPGKDGKKRPSRKY